MDTSSSQRTFDFRVDDLERSKFSEDGELAVHSEKVVKAIIEKLKPVLRYLAVPVPIVNYGDNECSNPNFHIGNPFSDYRAVGFIEAESSLPGATTLFLCENGGFIVAKPCPHSKSPGHYHFRTSADSLWKLMPFGKFMEFLRGALQQCEEKREQHLQSIRERREKLDEILEILKK